MGSGYSKMKKQAKMLEDQIEKMREDMEKQSIDGSAGNGLVQVVVDGDKRIKSLQIKPDCVDPDDLEGLQDLIIAALEDAYGKCEKQNDMSQLGGLGGLPNLF